MGEGGEERGVEWSGFGESVGESGCIPVTMQAQGDDDDDDDDDDD